MSDRSLGQGLARRDMSGLADDCSGEGLAHNLGLAMETRPLEQCCSAGSKVRVLSLYIEPLLRGLYMRRNIYKEKVFMTTQFGAKSTADDVLFGKNLKGKRVLVTGVSAGLGVETARALVAHGAEVVGAVRDLPKAERANKVTWDAAASGDGSFSLLELDLASLKSVRGAADKLLSEALPFDLIIANAGIMAAPFSKTEDDFELQFATNHLGHFVFVNRISSLLRTGGRLVTVSSNAHRFSNVDLDDPNFATTPYDPWLAYGRSKTANILLAIEFDRRHRDRGVRAVSTAPGIIATELMRHLGPGVMEGFVQQANEQCAAANLPPFELKSIPQGAATQIWAGIVASDSDVNGVYFEDCHVSPVYANDVQLPMSANGAYKYAFDQETAKALWLRSEALVGESYE